MPSWIANSELPVMLVVLGLLVREWFSIRRTLRQDREKARRRDP